MKNEEVKTYTIQELANRYNVRTRTIYNWILPIRQELLEMYPTQKKRIRLLFPKQVKRIYEFLGDVD